ncbi:MAG: hypothetical protein Ct9H300mP30_1400 [Methanobacteriota archaeon]|nr:MAG: hypothetical protein Ct9H300mP30_1400 [Euryarchaeota archaeon]
MRSHKTGPPAPLAWSKSDWLDGPRDDGPDADENTIIEIATIVTEGDLPWCRGTCDSHLTTGVGTGKMDDWNLLTHQERPP